MFSGTARFVGTIVNDHEIFSIMYPDDLELYQLDPPLHGYRIVAAAQSMWAMSARVFGDPDPPPPEDPVSTRLYGTTGGEGLQVVWRDELFKADGRVPTRALAEAGYRVWR
jgi:hypothetical protein